MTKSLEKEIQSAVHLLQSGEVVGMPTETVYGLAASIDSEKGLKRIFAAKNRPFFDPLIVHVASPDQAMHLAREVSPAVRTLMNTFWPGPLTLVLPKNENVSDLITAGLPTMAVRMPNHPVALEVIGRLGTPVAAPSANQFGRTSPTQKSHVEAEFPGENIFVLEGGPSEVGIESTVIRVHEGPESIEISILRPGFVGANDLTAALSESKKSLSFNQERGADAPGQLEDHYQPRKPLVLIRTEDRLEDRHLSVIGKALAGSQGKGIELKLNSDPRLAARELYAELHRLSHEPGDFIWTKKPPEDGLWGAILDRLKKASTLEI